VSTFIVVGGIVEAAATFLVGDGVRVARSALRRLGLPKDLLEDLTQEVLVRALRAEQRGDEVDNIEAFTVTLIQRAARDIIRGHLRRPEGHQADTPIEEALDGKGQPGPSVETEVVTRAHAAELRRLLAQELAAAPRQAAGALVVLAIAVDGATPADDVPVPKAGVAADEAVAWAGLFYAGLRDCFAGPHQPEDAAMRKRRSRALQSQRRLLQDLAATLATITDDDDA
jgi:DNA-directed RNA polymerase specialized sigma24 family protein